MLGKPTNTLDPGPVRHMYVCFQNNSLYQVTTVKEYMCGVYCVGHKKKSLIITIIVTNNVVTVVL